MLSGNGKTTIVDQVESDKRKAIESFSVKNAVYNLINAGYKQMLRYRNSLIMH